MKKILSVILLSCIILSFVACGANNTNSEENKNNQHKQTNLDISMDSLMKTNESDKSNFEYTITEDGVCINRYIGDDAVVVIPTKIENTEVYKIANQAFANNDTVQAIRIADTVTDLSGYGTFINCLNLKYLVLGEGVEVLGDYSVTGCLNLEEIRLNENLKKIGELGLYAGSDKLKEIYIPESVIEMDGGVFNPFSIIYVKAGSYAEEYVKNYTSALHDYVVE